jgi:hypothetical protein
MDFSNFSISWSCMAEILPNIEIPNYDVFTELHNSWNNSIQKYGMYIFDHRINNDLFLYFHLIKNMCDNKKLTIKNPLHLENNQPEIISSDIYFITRYSDNYNHGHSIPNYYPIDLIANYYFENENIVVGILLGTGDVGLHITVAYIIYYNQSKLVLFHHLNERLDCQSYPYYLPKIYDIIKNINTDTIKNEVSLVRTIDGYNFSLFHTLCSFVSGIYLLDSVGIKSNIDEVILGPNDPFLIEQYYRNKYENITFVKEVPVDGFDCNKLYKGVLFKYGHFHVTNKCAEFVKSYISKAVPISDEHKNAIQYISNKFYPIFSINLRCLTCEIKDQDIVISETIDKLKEIYPNSFFLIGGFLGDYNEEILNKLNVTIGVNSINYSNTLNEYQKVFASIQNKISHKDIKSLINLKINNILEYTKVVSFSINMNAGYTCIETILNNISSVYFGTKWIDHNKRMWYISKENYKEPFYIDDPEKINFISTNIYDEVTCEIPSDTLVNLILDYDKNNNNILSNINSNSNI